MYYTHDTLEEQKNHYRCYNLWLPATRGYRITQTIKFFPTYVNMPGISRQDSITLTAQELTKALLKSKDILNLQEKLLGALKQLVSIFEISTAPQRVKDKNNSPEKSNPLNKGPTTFVDRTTSEVVRLKKCMLEEHVQIALFPSQKRQLIPSPLKIKQYCQLFLNMNKNHHNLDGLEEFDLERI